MADRGKVVDFVLDSKEISVNTQSKLGIKSCKQHISTQEKVRNFSCRIPFSEFQHS